MNKLCKRRVQLKEAQITGEVATPNELKRYGHTAVYNFEEQQMIIYSGSDQRYGHENVLFLKPSFSNEENPTEIQCVEYPIESKKTPFERAFHEAFIHPKRNTMVVFGGSKTFEGTKMNELIEYDFENHVWSKITPSPGSLIPPPNDSFTMVYLESQDCLVVFGGSCMNADLYKFDFGSNTWSIIHVENERNGEHGEYVYPEQVPSPRLGHSAVMKTRSKMVIFGGWTKKQCYNETFEFNFKTNKWKLLSPSSAAGESSSTAGSSASPFSPLSPFGDTVNYYYDSMFSLPAARSGHKAVMFRHTNPRKPKKGIKEMLIFGGATSRPVSFFNDFWMFNSRTKQWVQLLNDGDYVIPRYYHSFVHCNDRQCIIFGGDSELGILPNAVVVTPETREEVRFFHHLLNNNNGKDVIMLFTQ